ncbi:MAG: TOBE domain-containing protein, partial [Nitrososphaerota archaeon]
EALTIGDRIAVINEGIIHQIDIPENVYNHPKTVFTARFIGSPPINLIECKLEKENGKCFLRTPELKFDFTGYMKLFENYENGHKFLLGIRPEDVVLHREIKKATGIMGTIQLIDNVGDEKIVSVKINDKILTSIVGKEVILDYGQKVYIEINMDKVHIFDTKDNKSIL